MRVENIWAGIIALLIGLVLTIGFGPTFSDLLGIVDPEARMFMGVLAVFTITTAGFFFPLETVISDDIGRTN